MKIENETRGPPSPARGIEQQRHDGRPCRAEVPPRVRARVRRASRELCSSGTRGSLIRYAQRYGPPSRDLPSILHRRGHVSYPFIALARTSLDATFRAGSLPLLLVRRMTQSRRLQQRDTSPTAAPNPASPMSQHARRRARARPGALPSAVERGTRGLVASTQANAAISSSRRRRYRRQRSGGASSAIPMRPESRAPRRRRIR